MVMDVASYKMSFTALDGLLMEPGALDRALDLLMRECTMSAAEIETCSITAASS